MIKKALLLCSTALVLFSACKKEEADKPSGAVKEISFLAATSYTEWTYFSFAKGDTVTITDYKNSLDWDIAFHRGDVRLNGGESGKGKAEAKNTNNKKWNDVTEAPKDGYVKDKVGKIMVKFLGDNIEEEDQPFSEVVSAWLDIDYSTPPPKYTISDWVYVVKAADGNYVKLQIYDNKDAKNKAGYVSFKYQYNESGSTKF